MARTRSPSLGKQQIVSAQVVLRPASGKSIRDRAVITAESLKEYTPSPEAVSAVARAFVEAGFEAGPMVGNSFSITAPVQTFERVFVTRLIIEERGAIKSMAGDHPASFELPLPKLAKAVTDHIEAITFTPPPDFGPTNFAS